MKRKNEVTGISEAIECFIAEKQASGLNDKTLADYKKDLLKLTAGLDSVQQLTQAYYIEYINKYSASRKPVSVNHYIREYRVFLYWLMDNEYIAHYKIKLLKEQEAPVKLYSIDDITKLLVKPTKTDSFSTWRTWAIISFMMATGARAGTVVNIHLDDIDLATQEVVYRHTKNKRSAVVPICDNLKTVLLLYTKQFQLTDLLFPTELDTSLNNHSLRMSLLRYCRQRGVEFNSVHAFRHTYAKQFIVNGGNPFQLQKMLNHQTLTMSQHYTHLFGTDLHGAVNDYSPLSKIAQPTGIKRR